MKLQNKDSIMNLGDTSFRRKNLLDDYKVLLQGITEQMEEWNTNNNSQMNFYQYVAKNGLIEETFYLDYYTFVSGKFKESILKKYKNKKGVEDFDSLIEYFVKEQKKRGRTYTNALVKIGLLNEKRQVTEVGENLLDEKIKEDNVEKLFNLSKDNLIFLRQLLKLKVFEPNGKEYIFPFRIGIYLLSKFDDIPQKEFTTILSLLRVGKEDKEYREILDKYKLVKNKKMSFNEYILKYIEFEDDKIDFTEKEKIEFETFKKYFLNRKSQNVIKDYYDFYEICFQFLIKKNEESYRKLEKISKKSSIKKAFGYNKVPFNFSKNINEFLDENSESIFRANSVKEFNRRFYELFKNSKNYDLVFEYSDMTVRTFNLCGLISFENNQVNLTQKWLTKKFFSKLLEKNNLCGKENEVDLFEKNISLSKIFNISENEILNFEQELRRENNISEKVSIFEYFSEKVDIEFENKLEKKYSNSKICEILKLFTDRKNDEKILKVVTDNAKIPTIFEYILAIAWHRISKKEFNLKKSLNLSLDGDGLPLSYAPGGNGDIIAEYKNFDVMIEATLMDKNTQKRGELEPVIRHTANLTIKNNEENKETYTFFVANELDTNVINIFRATSQIQLESTQKRQTYTNGIKIYSLSINDVVYLLENEIDYRIFIKNIFENYNKIGFISNNWHKNLWENAVKN